MPYGGSLALAGLIFAWVSVCEEKKVEKSGNLL